MDATHRLVGPVLFALALGCAAPVPVAPAPAVRVLAEWEPARGVLVAHPFRVPSLLLREMARDVQLVVLLRAGEADGATDSERAARTDLAAAGVDLQRVAFVPSSVQTEWTRDYGPHTVVRADGSAALVDADYIETPIFAADAPPVRRGEELRYPQRCPGDDRCPVQIAQALRLPRQALPAFVTGGNFLVDGRGTAFCTRALLDENRTRIADDELRRLLAEYLGIARLVVLDNTEAVGIQHVDCWLKLLDEETMLVKRAPPEHPEHARIERNVERLAQLPTWRGGHYRILRIDCPPYARERDAESGRDVDLLPAYTNSLILNRRVFVPLFGGPGDAAALATYRAALPGHDVVGVPYAEWKPFDALHCRTRAVFDVAAIE